MLWLECLKRDPSAYNDFIVYLQNRRDVAATLVLSADDWEGTLKGKGSLEQVDLIMSQILNYNAQEQTDVGRSRTNGQ